MSIKNMKLVRRRTDYIGVIEYANDNEGRWTVYEFKGDKWEKTVNNNFEFGDEIGNNWEEYFYTMLAISDEWQSVSGEVELDNNNNDDYE